MKKILIILLLVFLTSCTWNYKNGDIKKNVVAEDVKELEKELLELEQKKAKETLEKIKLENEIASEVLENFLKSEDFDIKAEIEKTKSKYNDSLGPILEYEHEKKPENEGTASGKTLSGATLSGSTVDTQSGSNIKNLEKKLIYSGETNFLKEKEINTEKNIIKNDSEENIVIEKDTEVKYNTQVKKGRSGTYTMYIGLSDTCKGGLEMTDLENSKRWLFENTCDKMIYNFELAVGGIKVYYNDPKGIQNNEFVTLK